MPIKDPSKQKLKEKLKAQANLLQLQMLEKQREEEQEARELEELLMEDAYRESEQNFYEFFVNSWEYFDPEPYKDNWHIQCICEHAQAAATRDIKRLLVTIPPRHGKSKILSVCLPAWIWGPHKRPHEKFITASYNFPLATELLVNSRQVMNHPWYKTRWMGGRTGFNFTDDGNTKTRIDNDKGGYRVVTSPGGSGLGLGYSIAIIDDPLNGQAARSEIERNNVLNWYRGTLKNRANDPDTDVIIIVQQRLHTDDLAGFVLENEEYFHLNIMEEFEKKYTFLSPIGFNDPRKHEGQLIDPNRFNEDFIESQKSNPYEYAAMYQQRPAPADGGIIKRDWCKTYFERPKYFDSVIMSFDLSMTDSISSDYTVGTVWGKLGGQYYLLDMRRGKMDIVGQLAMIQELTDLYPEARAKLIEAKANGPAVIKMLDKHISGIIPVEPKEFGGNKEGRVHACIPEFASRSVLFPSTQDCPWVEDVINELLIFPRGRHDDIVDSITYAINWLALNQRTFSVVMNDSSKGNSATNQDSYKRRSNQKAERNTNPGFIAQPTTLSKIRNTLNF